MKKYLLIILAAVAGMFLSSCVEKEIVTFHEGDLVAPALNDLSQTDYILAEGGAFDDFVFTKASVGLSASIQYEVFAVLEGDGAKPKSLGKVTNKEAITVDANTINNVLIGLECPPDVAVAVNFYITANWMSQSNKAIGIATTSNIISANVTPFYSEKTYKSIFFRGGFNGWGALNAHRLFCYAEDDNTYMGTVDFDGEGKIADHITQGFKFADDTWGDINLGSSASEAEASSIALVSGGDNIMIYTAHRYYSFQVDIQGLTAKKLYGFDKMGVIGLDGKWGDNDDIEMTWNAYFGRFWADVEVASATEFKVRMDGSWDNNWGLGGIKGAGNVPIESGNYRIYFYFSNVSAPNFEINADMYGKEEPKEPTPPEPEFEGWSIMGEINGGVWDKDVDMTEDPTGVWSATTTIQGQFKLRKAHDYSKGERGGQGDGDFVDVVLDSPMTALSEGGKNFKIGSEGLYKVTYNSTDETITVSSMANKWSVIGMINGGEWDKDYFMTKNGDVWTSDPITINGAFKLRFNAGWDVNMGAPGDVEPLEVALKTPFGLVQGGKNLIVNALDVKYIVAYDEVKKEVTITKALPENLWSVIGQVEGTGWDTDFYMTEVSKGVWTSDLITINGAFKVRFNNDWEAGNRGATGDVEPYGISAGVPVSVIHGGKNFSAPEVDKKYIVVYDSNLEKVYLMGFGVIGVVESYDWSKDMPMTVKNGEWRSGAVLIKGAFKVRYNGGWDTNFGAPGSDEPVIIAPDTDVDVAAGGKNFAVAEEGYYFVIFNETTSKFRVERADWGVVGQVSGSNWDRDFYMDKQSDGSFVVRHIKVDAAFKIRYRGGWDTNRGATGDVEPLEVTVGTPLPVIGGGKNLTVGDKSKFYDVTYNPTAETITVTETM